MLRRRLPAGGIARAWLGAQGIPIDASDVGGLVGRRLFFEIPSGQARTAPVGGRA